VSLSMKTFYDLFKRNSCRLLKTILIHNQLFLRNFHIILHLPLFQKYKYQFHKICPPRNFKINCMLKWK